MVDLNDSVVDQLTFIVQDVNYQTLNKLHTPVDPVKQAKQDLAVITKKCERLTSELTILQQRIDNAESKIKRSNENLKNLTTELSQKMAAQTPSDTHKQQTDLCLLIKEVGGLQVDIICWEKEVDVLKKAQSQLKDARGSLSSCTSFHQSIVDNIARKSMRMKKSDEERHIKWAHGRVEDYEKIWLWEYKQFQNLIEIADECAQTAIGQRMNLDHKCDHLIY